MEKNIIILFDLDGTLIDSTEAILESFYKAFEIEHFYFIKNKGNDEKIKNLIGYPLDIMFVSLGVLDDKKWDFVNAYKEHYRKISKEKTFLLKNAIEAIKLASSFARVSVVTTKTKRYTIPLLENLDIMKYFEIITGRECVENPKPHPEPILKTLNEMNYNKTIHKAYMIGDTKLDLISASESQIKSVGVLCGYGKKKELSLYTKLIENSSFEAVNLIKKMNS